MITGILITHRQYTSRWHPRSSGADSQPPRLAFCCLASLATRSHGAGFPTLRPTSPRPTSSVLPRLLTLAAAKAPPWNLLSRFARQLAVSLRSTAARFAGLLTGLFHSRITCVMRSFHSLVDRLLTLFALHYAPLYYASALTLAEIVKPIKMLAYARDWQWLLIGHGAVLHISY